MNANIQFGRRIRPVEVIDVQQNVISILYTDDSQNSKTSNITVGAEPYILVAFGLTGAQKIVVNNVFQNIEEPAYYDGEPIELTATNNIVILPVTGIYNCVTTEPLGTFTLIAYTATAMGLKFNKSVAASNPNGPHSQLPNTFFDGGSGDIYSQDFYVGAVPFVFRAYGITTQTIELEALFRDKAVTVTEDGMPVVLNAIENTLVIVIAGRYRLKLIGDSTDVVVATNPTAINYSDPFLRKGEKGDTGLPGGAPVQFTQASATTTWNIPHNLGHKPVVAVFSVGWVEIMGEVTHIDDNNTVITFDTAQNGFAVLI